ncbi:MAG: hypothetical protein KJ587_20170, partial [Alphaproteobacteria bacterium]|nr:hypothetical protein [Alphaproteobacteria bacterium]
MSVSTLLAKEAQHRGYRMRIAGIRYYWTSSPNVPALTDPAGGSLDYVRVDGALKGIPRTLPMKTHPLKMPQVLSTTIEFLDVDGRLTEIWATEQESPITQLTADLAAAAVTATVLLGPASIGLTAFPSSGLLYIDNETIQYTGKGVLSFTGLVRGKYHSDDVAHDEYHLASNQLSREVYGFIPHLWFREVVLECFDMETAHLGSPVSEVLARGFLQEP